MSFQAYAILVILGSANIALLSWLIGILLRRKPEPPKPPEPIPFKNIRKKGLNQRYIR